MPVEKIMRSRCCIGLLSLTLLALQQPIFADEPDAFRADLEKAKKAYAEAVAKSNSDLLSALDDAILAAAKDAALEEVKELQAARKEFDATGKLPTTNRLGKAKTEFSRANIAAIATMDKAYDEAVKSLTKALKIEQADAIKTEWKDFQRTCARGSTPKTAPITMAPRPPGMPGPFEYIFYECKKGDKIKMIHKDEGFCYLVGIHGAFYGGGESAQITIEKDGYWYLTVVSANAQPLDVRAVAVKLTKK
jgi:tetratricopeptide (TPR) repeat protein